jgi:signal transduction histidine kinase
LELRADYKDELPTVEIDSTRIAQVLDNLISNAVKYAPNAPVTIRVREADRQLEFEVEDEGPGISPEHLAHLFERFYRVPDGNQSTRGTGLGLYICRKIIEAHDGEIGVDSEPGEGTRFHFRIPVNTESSPRVPEEGS